MNFSRQMELYDAEYERDDISVIGVGATGSWVALLLSKLGVKFLQLFDMDIIEEHNVPNQLYGKDDCNKLKTKICRNYCNKLGSGVTTVLESPQVITPENFVNMIASDTVFCLVDSMSARKELFDAALSSRNISTWIETRMGLTGYRIYMIDLNNQKEVDKYKETLYSDDEAEVSACGASQSVVTTAMQCASHAVGLWLAKKNNAEYIPNEIIFDVHSSFIMSRQFDKKEEKDGETDGEEIQQDQA